MKKILFLAAFFTATAAFISCGNDTSAAEQKMQPQKVEEAPKPVTETPSAVYLSVYNEEKILNNGCDGANCVNGSFNITFGEDENNTVTIKAYDRLDEYKESLAVETNNLKALYKELKTKKAGDFIITTLNNEIIEVWLKEIKKEGKDGAVGDIIPKRPIWSKQ